MVYPMLSILVGCSLMIWLTFLIGTEEILLYPLSGFVLTSPYQNGMDLVASG